MPELARAWQMLLKGSRTYGLRPVPLLAAEMVLVRLAYAAELLAPAELVSNSATAPKVARPARQRPATRDVPAPQAGRRRRRHPCRPAASRGGGAVRAVRRADAARLALSGRAAGALSSRAGSSCASRRGRRPICPVPSPPRWGAGPGSAGWSVSPAATSAPRPRSPNRPRRNGRPASIRSPRTQDQADPAAGSPGQPSWTCARPHRAEHR